MAADHWLGIDLGTSSVRALILGPDGLVRGVAGRSYRIDSPRPGWAEQDPGLWWDCATACVREVLRTTGLPAAAVAGVGVTGQMHGLVCLDADDLPVRPAIIWPDLRCAGEIAELTTALGAEEIHRITGMSPATGQFGPNLAWVARNEPDVYARTASTLLPKDQLRLRLTGRRCTDPSDACGTLLFDITTGAWSPQVVGALGLDVAKLVEVVPSDTVVGAVTPEAAAATGLLAGTPVVAGGGDQATAAMALDLLHAGQTSVAVSSGGTVVQMTDHPRHPAGAGLHTLCSADGRWMLMGACLSAGLALGWVAETVGAAPGSAFTLNDLVGEAGQVAPGADGLLFLPYLAGERTPHLDPSARGVFLGLQRTHTRAHLTRAVLEGVGFALRDCLETVTAAGSVPPVVVASGGGTRNPVWRQILADVLEVSLQVSAHDEHSATGAALLAARGVAGLAVPPPDAGPTTRPYPALRDLYDARHQLFHRAYAANRQLMHELAAQS